MSMIDLDPARAGVPPREAATLVVVRDAPGSGGGVEVFCVERQKVGFLGGAIVFPGGKLDPADVDAAWSPSVTAPRATKTPWAADDATTRGLAIAACREALEEAAILPVTGEPLAHAELLDWRARVARGETTLRALLTASGRTMDLASLVPFARWITPIAEARRYDTRFFVFVAGDALTGAHDDHETTASFWARPAEVLRRFVAAELQLAPPTHRTLEILAGAKDARDAVAIAEASCLDPVCPRMVTEGGVVALVLPGDREHDVKEPRSPGKSRYVLRGDRFLPEDAPGSELAARGN
jgi:8-oxo-dGTP pyrophosphatase MutT (NUDIX family)